MKKSLLLILLVAVASSGCSSFDLTKALENRVACTVNRDEAHTISRYGFFGFAFKVSEKDTPILCTPVPNSVPTSTK